MKSNNLLFIVILNLFFSQEFEEIDYFYNYANSQPFITFDPVNNTAFYLNEYNPQFPIDFQILDVNINGSSLAPIGTYYMNDFYHQFISDTISSNSFEHNRGDYAYYENTILVCNKNNNFSSLIMGQGRSQPVYDISNPEVSKGNTLQNYFFNLNKTYFYKDNHSLYFSASSMYHKEDINIPGNFLDSSYYSRVSDSYMYGLTTKLNSNKFNVNFSASSQIMRGNHLNRIMFDEYTNWVDLDLQWDFNDYFSINSKLHSKTNSRDLPNSDSLNKFDLIDADLKVVLNYDDLITSFSIKNINFYYNTPNPSSTNLNFNLSYKFEKLNLLFSIGKKTEAIINRGVLGFNADYSENSLNQQISIFDIYSINVQYKNKLTKFGLEPYTLKNIYNNLSALSQQSGYAENLEINGLKSFGYFKNDNIISNFNSVIYLSDDLIPLNSYLNYSFLLSPKIKDKRFRPFIGFSGSYVDLNSAVVIDPYFGYQDIYNILNTENESKKLHLFSAEFGFIIKGFKLTYSFINPLDEEILFSSNESHDAIKSFSNLKINWQFLD